MSSEAKLRGNGNFLVFERVFRLRLSRSPAAGSCTILVVDGADAPVAVAEVPVAELLEAASQKQEFFSFALRAAGSRRVPPGGRPFDLDAEEEEQGETPHVAMRVREAGCRDRLAGSPFEGYG